MASERTCDTCGRPNKWTGRNCDRCRKRRRDGIDSTTSRLCDSVGCTNIAQTRAGTCVEHHEPVAWLRPTPGPLDTDCLEYVGARHRTGYGEMRSGPGERRVHRWVWTIMHGPIPTGMFVLHSCDNPPCANPEHLRLGTHAENMADRSERGRTVTKLTDDDVRAIRHRYSTGGVTQKALGREFGITPQAVGQIINRRTWSHVTD